MEANDVGRYYAPNLPLGRCRVTVQKGGFGTATSDAVEISSQVNVRVDIRLQRGSTTDTVQVSSQAELLDTATATVSASVSTKELHELPFIRFGQTADIANYLQYLPGAENTPALTGAPAGSSVTPIMDGAQAYVSEVFVDGAPASDGVFRGSLWENGSAVNHYGEFNIVANSFSAEYGRTGTYALGNTARTFDWLRGPGFSTESASTKKKFRIHERFTTRLSGDFQNPFNFVRWGNPVTSLAASNFGMIASSSPGRRVQLSLKIPF